MINIVAFAKAVTPPAAEGEVSESNVKAVFMNEITDRPSSYFFQLSSKLNDNVPFFKDKSTKDMLHVVKKFGSSIGVFVSTKNLNSPDMFEAVKRTAANCILYSFSISLLLYYFFERERFVRVVFVRIEHVRGERRCSPSKNRHSPPWVR